LIVNTRTGEVRFGPDAGRSLFPRGFQIIAVTVTAGFDPVPADVQEAQETPGVSRAGVESGGRGRLASMRQDAGRPGRPGVATGEMTA